MPQGNHRTLQGYAGEKLAEDKVAGTAVAQAMHAGRIKHADGARAYCLLRMPPNPRPDRRIGRKLARRLAQQRDAIALAAARRRMHEVPNELHLRHRPCAPTPDARLHDAGEPIDLAKQMIDLRLVEHGLE